jgi:hypothetical protein
MAIAFGSAGERIATVTTTNTPTLPTGTTPGDFLCAHIAHGATTTIATPATWNSGVGFTFGTYRMHMFWKFAGVGETDPSFTVSALGNYGVVSRYTGVPSRANPFNVAPAGTTSVFSAGPPAVQQGAAVVPSIANTMVVWLWTTSDNSVTGAGGAGATAAYSGGGQGVGGYDSVVGSDGSMFSAYKVQATAASTGIVTIAAASGAATGLICFALDPTPLPSGHTFRQSKTPRMRACTR